MKKTIVGLTGGIASGKSTAARLFADAGAYVINTDAVSREVADGVGKRELMRAFPSAFEDGALARKRLRRIVFSDESERQKLNGILHPYIRERTKALAAASAARVTVIEAPLLFEANFDSLTDIVVTVSCSEQTRIERLTARDTISEDLARRMLRSQLSDPEREARADIVLYNDGSLPELRAQVLRVYGDLAG